MLQGAEPPAEHIVRRIDARAERGPLVFAIFAYFETLIAAVYTGIGERALRARGRDRPSRRARSRVADPTQRTPTSAVGWPRPPSRSTARAAARRIARDLDDGVDHGARWFPKLVGLKVRATETAG